MTDRRIIVPNAERVALNVAIHQIRRVQFDIEGDPPATLVIVPEHPDHPTQVLALGPPSYRAACDALAVVGGRMAEA